jgi:Rod binding protein
MNSRNADMRIGNDNAATSSQLPAMMALRNSAEPSLNSSLKGRGMQHGDSVGQAKKPDELRERFTQFVGEAFFGQMIKAMRATVGKPAYFHGGRAEEVFQGQLDQKLAEHLTEASADKFSEPMFERQFPHLTEHTRPGALKELESLRRM